MKKEVKAKKIAENPPVKVPKSSVKPWAARHRAEIKKK